MCIIVAKTLKAQHPDIETLRSCWNRNPNGAGIAYPDVNGGISMVKGLMTFDDFMEAMKPLLELKADGIFYVLHFRIATHGTVNKENSHPLCIRENKVAIAHNGVLPYSRLCESGKGR